MRRWSVFLIAAAAVLLLPNGQQTEIGDLQPVQLLYIYKEDGAVVLKTDMDDMGKGKTLHDALDDLHATATGVLFLDTVEYLLVTEETWTMVPQLGEMLRPSTNLVMAMTPVDPAEAAGYLTVRRPEVTLLDQRTGASEFPKLIEVEGRYYLE